MLLELQNVSKSFSRNGHQVQALQDVSFRIEPSQFVAVRGPSGCGKTTLLLVSGGLLRPDAGEVSLSGHELYTLSPENRAGIRSAHIGFVFQQFHLIPYLNVVDNVLASSLGLVMENASERRELYDRAIELVERFGLMDRSKHLPSELSTGQRQRVALARALLNRPKLLLADEPTGNLDKENSVIVWQYLREFAAEDRAVLMVTHDSVAAERADRVIEMEAPREIS
ncbi:MAG: ABC transporter ATP-binding protein [Pirellulaceae bacterium]|nr:ABC transporter ATP-binding protein [Pirellulaceae bacterium]